MLILKENGLINPQRMREGYGGRFVCHHASCYTPYLHIVNKMPLGFLWLFKQMKRVVFVENALFKSYGDIC